MMMIELLLGAQTINKTSLLPSAAVGSLSLQAAVCSLPAAVASAGGLMAHCAAARAAKSARDEKSWPPFKPINYARETARPREIPRNNGPAIGLVGGGGEHLASRIKHPASSIQLQQASDMLVVDHN